MKKCRLCFLAIIFLLVLNIRITAANAVEPQIAAGEGHTIVLKSNGTLWAWGHNGSGQLGIGSTDDSDTPVQIGSDTDWVAVKAGNRFTIARKANGTLWAWGYNADRGQLGDGTTENRLSPVQIGSDTDWAAMASGWDYTVAIKTGGTLWAWGSNSYGQLGLGGTNDDGVHHTPVQIGSATDWSAVIAGGAHIIARRGGGLWVWGNDSGGQLGDNSTTDRTAPFQIGTETDWATMIEGKTGTYHTLIAKTDGTLYVCGANTHGQLGLGTAEGSPHKILVPIDSNTNWTTMTAGGYLHTIARKSNGTLWAWGFNAYGQLGVGLSDNLIASPTQIGSESNWTTVTAGHWHTLALKGDGTLWSWGSNGNGQLGIGSHDNDRHLEPVQVMNVLSYSLTINMAGPGTGTVTGAGNFDYGTTQQIRATANPGSLFTGWSGDCDGTTNPLDVLMDGDKTCIATFQEKFPWTMFLPAINK